MATVAVHFDTLEADDGELALFSGVIDAAERARAARFRFARDRRRFVVRRAKLRLVLGEIVGEVPEALVFTENTHGKPALYGGGPCFSLSHSGERMMLAVANVAVGCDIERIDGDIDWRPIASGLFSVGELAALAIIPEGSGARAFFDCWARKEAFVKALGLGLSYPLDAFTVAVSAEPCILAGGAGWSIAAVPGEPGYATAVVAQCSDVSPVTGLRQMSAMAAR